MARKKFFCLKDGKVCLKSAIDEKLEPGSAVTLTLKEEKINIFSEDGTKKFLSGQRTKGAVAVIDNKGVPILCEGYATAMSIRRALKAVKARYKIIICFSAGNMLEVSKEYRDGFLVADNDATGIRVAKATGLPYWVSDVDGEDFNDAELRMGAMSAGECLLKLIGKRGGED